MKKRIVRVPATTNNITTGIINLLLSEGHSASRINTSPLFEVTGKSGSTVSGYFRKSGARTGVSDIIACLQIRRYGIALGVGQFVAIEIKNTLTNDRPSPAQIEFAKEIQSTGGIYLTIGRYQEFVDWYDQSPFKKP